MSTKEKELKEFNTAAISVTPRASERIKRAMKIENKENWNLRMSNPNANRSCGCGTSFSV